MRVKVKSVFIDKYTNKKHIIGEELEVSPKRYTEIQDYVEKIKTKKGQE